jgi:thiamine biosynthesis lipoprotein
MNSHQLTFEAIGTKWVIDIYSEISEDQKTQITQNVRELIEEFDKTFSRFRKDSVVTQMSKKAGVYQMPDYALPLLSLYQKLYQLTDGAVTPLIGNVLVDAGYDHTYSLKSKSIRPVLKWEDVIEISSIYSSNLIIHQPAVLDFGAAGKGYLVDLVGSVLQENGIDSFCVDAGGDILYRSNFSKKLRVGLENPDNTSQVIGVAEILNQSICGSVPNRRAWGTFHHIMNPKTLQSENSVKAVWVIAESGLVADGLATALFFVEPKVLEKEFQFEYVIIYPNQTVKNSVNFQGELYYT